jgi:hypothetical protein
MNAIDNLIKAGEELETRLKLFKKTALQAVDCGDTHVELPIQVLWEPSDDAAVLRWESAKAAILNQKPLFSEDHYEPA